MSLFHIFKRKVETVTSHDDFAIYEEVCAGIERGERDLGVWGKAYSQVGGDEAKAKAKYIELMVSLRKEEIAKKRLEHQSRIKRVKMEIGNLESAVRAKLSTKDWFKLLLVCSIGCVFLAPSAFRAGLIDGIIVLTLSFLFIMYSFHRISAASSAIEDYEARLRHLKESLEEFGG